jgi:hypothetical protein
MSKQAGWDARRAVACYDIVVSIRFRRAEAGNGLHAKGRFEPAFFNCGGNSRAVEKLEHPYY